MSKNPFPSNFIKFSLSKYNDIGIALTHSLLYGSHIRLITFFEDLIEKIIPNVT